MLLPMRVKVSLLSETGQVVGAGAISAGSEVRFVIV